MRWEDLNLTDDELRGRSMLEGNNEEECFLCGQPSKYIDYCYEARICSEECQKTMNDDYERWLEKVANIPLE